MHIKRKVPPVEAHLEIALLSLSDIWRGKIIQLFGWLVMYFFHAGYYEFECGCGIMMCRWMLEVQPSGDLA